MKKLRRNLAQSASKMLILNNRGGGSARSGGGGLVRGVVAMTGGRRRRSAWTVPLGHGRAGGETGIRTLDTLSSIHAFQACAFSHSAISPLGKLAETPIPKAGIGAPQGAISRRSCIVAYRATMPGTRLT